LIIVLPAIVVLVLLVCFVKYLRKHIRIVE
jgi:hypothetical protein